jgi:hypothetical protein
MKTDLDRLHGVVLGEITGRRAGYTMAHCHEVASVIELGETEVILLLPRLDWQSHVLPMLDEVLQERGIGRLERSGRGYHEYNAGNATILVKSASQPSALLGRRGVCVEVIG